MEMCWRGGERGAAAGAVQGRMQERGRGCEEMTTFIFFLLLTRESSHTHTLKYNVLKRR